LGAPLWTNRYHGPNFYDDQPNAVAVDAAGKPDLLAEFQRYQAELLKTDK
jgi:hypothetical protein